MRARRRVEEVALDLGVDLTGKTQEELWDEIVRRITSRGSEAETSLPHRRRESPPFRWAVRRVPGA